MINSFSALAIRFGGSLFLLWVGWMGQPATAAVDPASLPPLLARAQAEGLVPVLIELAMDRSTQGMADTQYRAALAQAQEAVLQDLPREIRERATRFRVIPSLALWADVNALEKLANHPQVKRIREQRSYRLVEVGRPPLPGPELSDSVPQVGGSPQGDFQGFTGAGWAVAILDTGVNSAHPFLVGKVVAEACFSTTVPGQPVSTVCPNGADQMIGPGAGVPCSAFVVGCDHGTHVAGIAAGNGQGVPGAPPSGVARDAQLIAVQVFSRVDDPTLCDPLSSPCITAFDEDILQGAEFVMQQAQGGRRIAAVNLSLGAGIFNSEAECDAQFPERRALFNQLQALGIAVVAAAGNEGRADGISAPACLSNVIAVGSVTKTDQISQFSNSGLPLDLWAPGGDGLQGAGDILSSVPGGGFERKAGTSMAAPHVAGAWAVYKQKFPQASVAEVFSAFQIAGVSITDARNGITRPRLRLDAALEQAPQPPQPPTPPDDLVLRAPPREIARPGVLCLKTMTLQNLRGEPTGNVRIVDVRPVGAGWGPGVQVRRGPGQLLRDGGIAVILLMDRTCVGDDLTVEIEFSNGLIGTAGLFGSLGRPSPRPEAALVLLARAGLLEVEVRAQRAISAVVARMSLQLVGLDGRIMLQGQTDGPRLVAWLRDEWGRPLANGVYLAVITTEWRDGRVQREIRMIVVLR